MIHRTAILAGFCFGAHSARREFWCHRETVMWMRDETMSKVGLKAEKRVRAQSDGGEIVYVRHSTDARREPETF